MNLFENIAKTILNEVSSEEAYNTYYSSIPREIFDRITGGQKKFDRFTRFFLDAIKNGDCTPEESIEAIEKYREADPLIKQNVKEKQNAGEYQYPFEIAKDIDYMTNGGGIMSRKKFAESGLKVIGGNEEWKVTCTTNYLANNHYYSKTKWCTASDRLGAYDGYRMFHRYALDEDCILIQFVSKNNDVPDRYSCFQVQLGENKRIGQICDKDDYALGAKKLSALTNGFSKEFIANYDFSEMLQIQREQAKVEQEYQDAKTPILDEKRNRDEARRDKIVSELRPKLEEIRGSFREKCVNEIQQNIDLLDDNNFVTELIKFYRTRLNDGRESTPIKENEAAKVHFLEARRITRDDDTEAAIWRIGPGSFDYSIRSIAFKTPEICLFSAQEYQSGAYKGYFVATDENCEIIWKSDPIRIDEGYVNINYNVEASVGPAGTFFWIKIGEYGEKGSFIMDIKTKEARKLTKDANRHWVRCRNNIKIDNEILFYRENEDGCFVWSDENNVTAYKEYKFRTFDDYTTIATANKGVIITETGEIAYTFANSGGLKFHGAVDSRHINDKVYCELRFIKGGGRMVTNAFCLDDKKMIFGFFSSREIDLYYEDDKISSILYRDGEDGRRETRKIVYDATIDRYWFVNTYNGRYIDCNKFGETPEETKNRKEKNAMVGKNIARWKADKANKSQIDKDTDSVYGNKNYQSDMDKMWADREADIKASQGKAGMEAMGEKSREDNDLLKYYPEIGGDMFKGLGHDWGNGEDWGGEYGVRDPVGHRDSMLRALNDVGPNDLIHGNVPDYVRRNPFYRVDRNGRPIDQPWYDEDEVPARFTDPDLNEGHKTLISLMKRMGLFD